MAGRIIVLEVQVHADQEGLPFGFAPLPPDQPALVVFNSNLSWVNDRDSNRPKHHKNGSGGRRSAAPTDDVISLSSAEEVSAHSIGKSGGNSRGRKTSTVNVLSQQAVREMVEQHVIGGGIGRWADLVNGNSELQKVATRTSVREIWRSIEKDPEALGRIVHQMKLKKGDVAEVEALLTLARARKSGKKEHPKIKGTLLKNQDKGKTRGRKVKISFTGPKLESTTAGEVKETEKGKGPKLESTTAGEVKETEKGKGPKLETTTAGEVKETEKGKGPKLETTTAGEDNETEKGKGPKLQTTAGKDKRIKKGKRKIYKIASPWDDASEDERISAMLESWEDWKRARKARKKEDREEQERGRKRGESSKAPPSK